MRLEVPHHLSMISMLCAITMATCRVDITLVGTVHTAFNVECYFITYIESVIEECIF